MAEPDGSMSFESQGASAEKPSSRWWSLLIRGMGLASWSPLCLWSGFVVLTDLQRDGGRRREAGMPRQIPHTLLGGTGRTGTRTPSPTCALISAFHALPDGV